MRSCLNFFITYKAVIVSLVFRFIPDQQKARTLHLWERNEMSKWIKKYPRKLSDVVFQGMSAY